MLGKIFKVLSDPTRRYLLELLRQGPKSVGELAVDIGLTNATLSYHLSMLKQAGLVSDTRKGKYIYYQLETYVVQDLLLWLTSLKANKEQENEYERSEKMSVLLENRD